MKASVLFLGLFLTLSCFAQELGGRSVLVIIDMQTGFISRNGMNLQGENPKKVFDLIKNQKKLIQAAKNTNTPIILIEYKTVGKTDPEITKAIGDYPHARVIEKYKDGMFDDPEAAQKLKNFLSEEDARTLIITGANGGGCVLYSIRGALKEGYNVTAAPEAIADFNYDEFIYPFEGYYSRTSLPKCPSCTFQERSNFELAKIMAKNETKSNPAISDSDRAQIKDIPSGPLKKPQSKSTQK